MACVLNIAAVALVVIAAHNRCSAYAEDSVAELCNAWHELWKEKERLWTLYTDDEIFGKCHQQKRENITNSYVMLNTSEIIGRTKVSTLLKWSFMNNDSMVNFVKSLYRDGEQVQVLLYQEADGSCAVATYQLWYYYDEAGKNKYDSSKTEPWETCRNITAGNYTHACLSRPSYVLYVDDDHKDTVPPKCKDEYDNRRDKIHRPHDYNIYTEDCKTY
ncbi:uncharacterized protein [Dermacentor albipictus]|uniref:uncharacterized protein n=1 Tax=Dermacentor albipictus TaxID=60249 RepID=UPI0038FC6809